MTLSLLLNTIFCLLNLSWARDAFNEGREGWGWAYLALSAWCASSILLEVL